jgi:hypothetical protein
MFSSLYVPSSKVSVRSPVVNLTTHGIQAAGGVSSSYDALLELFECLGSFLKRLEIYINIPPTPIMTDILVKIMIQLLSVLALATKQIRQGRFSKRMIMYHSY